jgi:hypothetical protein
MLADYATELGLAKAAADGASSAQAPSGEAR